MTVIKPIIAGVQRYGKKSGIALFCCAILVLQAACVSNISSQVKESNKDTTGTHDGAWVAQIQRSAERQHVPGNWIVICDPSAKEFTFNVKDGVAQIRHYNKLQSTFVSQNGDFRFDLPLNDVDRVGASAQLALKGRNLVFYGNLDNAKGRYTIAYEDFGNNGCTAVVEFVRKGKVS